MKVLIIVLSLSEALTKATTCYGCGGKVRDKPSSDPPPAPYDIFLCRYERLKKGRFSQSTTLNVTTHEGSVTVLSPDSEMFVSEIW